MSQIKTKYITDHAVTNIKLAQMPANTVKANTTGSTANAADASLGTVTEVTSSVLTLTGWADATIGSPTIRVLQASGSQSGFLSSTDWTTFNGKQASGNYITALTGDGTATGPGSVAFTLATVNSNVGTFASVTVNGKGLVTAATALSGDATTSGAVLTLATVNSNVGSFGSSTAIPSFTVNAKGLITAASTNVVIAPAGTLTGTTLASNVVSSSLTSVGTITTGVWNGTAVDVAHGGTGDSSFTAYSVITGGTTSTGALQNVSGVGTSGQVLTSNGASALPTWQAASSGTNINARYHSATATIGSALSVITYSTSDFDTNSAYSSGTYTIPTTGKYHITAQAFISATVQNDVKMAIKKNSTVVSETTVLGNAAAQDNLGMISDTISFASGDTFAIEVASNGTSPTISIITPTVYNVFSVFYVGT